jgi:hypothetical protein
MRMRGALWVTCGVFLAGCGAAGRPASNPRWAQSPSADYGYKAEGDVALTDASDRAPARPPASPPAASRQGSPTPSSAEPSPAQSFRAEGVAPEPTPHERPGLGTEWGETTQSPVHDVTFLRATPDQRPFAVSQLYYNDKAGVDALVAYHGGSALRSSDVSFARGIVSVYVVDKEWGMPLNATGVGARTYVVGEEGHRYSILVANHTGRRFEVVATVDGLDVISGRAASFENSGYVLSPWSTVEIDGFRQSEDAVAAFRFAKVGDSYAARRGDARNVGVIGVAFFAERGDDWSAGELRMRDAARAFPEDRRFAPPPWWAND